MQKFRIEPRGRTLLATLLLVIGTIGAGFAGATAASADTTVHTLVSNVPESWGPYLNSAAGYIVDSGTNITISCYVTGQSVSGPYGSEDVWDLVTGGIEANGSYVETGVFVPDAQVYTGSNSPVVPGATRRSARSSAATGSTCTAAPARTTARRTPSARASTSRSSATGPA